MATAGGLPKPGNLRELNTSFSSSVRNFRSQRDLTQIFPTTSTESAQPSEIDDKHVSIISAVLEEHHQIHNVIRTAIQGNTIGTKWTCEMLKGPNYAFKHTLIVYIERKDSYNDNDDYNNVNVHWESEEGCSQAESKIASNIVDDILSILEVSFLKLELPVFREGTDETFSELYSLYEKVS